MKIHRKIGTFENLEKWASQKNWDFRDFRKIGFSKKLGLGRDLRPEASPKFMRRRVF